MQVAGADGSPLACTLEGANGLRELATIVVAGTVRTAGESLVLDAEKIYIEPN